MAEHVVQTPAEPVKLGVSLDDLAVKSTDGDLVFIRARLLDANGTVVPDSGKTVTFAAADGYEIVGPSVATTEAGIASVLVRVKGAKGAKAGISAEAGALRGRL